MKTWKQGAFEIRDWIQCIVSNSRGQLSQSNHHIYLTSNSEHPKHSTIDSSELHHNPSRSVSVLDYFRTIGSCFRLFFRVVVASRLDVGHPCFEWWPHRSDQRRWLRWRGPPAPAWSWIACDSTGVPMGWVWINPLVQKLVQVDTTMYEMGGFPVFIYSISILLRMNTNPMWPWTTRNFWAWAYSTTTL